MFSYNHYVGIFKSKAGEFSALTNLSSETKLNFTPFIDIIDPIFSEDEPEKLDEYLKKIAQKIFRSWGIEYPIFSDLTDFKLSDRTSEGIHLVNYFHSLCSEKGISCIPTTGLDRDTAYNKAVLSVKDKILGVCIRLLYDDIVIPTELNFNLGLILEELKLDKDEVHILIDFKSIKLDKINLTIDLAINAINTLGEDGWRSITVACSSMPQSLSEQIKPNDLGLIPRCEYIVWKNLLKNSEKLCRLPSFGDYGVVHPDQLDLDPRLIANTICPSIRYTIDEEWVIVRGRPFAKFGYEQYYDLAEKIVNCGYFYGPEFSYGDGLIEEKSRKIPTTGNPQKWITIGTNHHIAVVTEQLKGYK